MATPERPYHHGDLRRALLERAIEVIDDVGPGAMSMREVSRRAGVTHAAATHHFGDKAGLLTAIATEGYELLGRALREARERERNFLEVGVAYVRFAVEHRAHFEVMFRPELYHQDNEQLEAAKAITAGMLYGSDNATDAQLADGVAAWAIVHGVAALWLDGNLPERLGDDPEQITRVVASRLRVKRS